MVGRAETREIYGIRYRVSRKASNAAQVAVFTSRSGLTVWSDSRVAEPVTADRVRVVSRDSERVVLEMEQASAGLVRVGDLRFIRAGARGVDGVRRPVQELDTVRAVQVPAGRHTVEFFYRPARPVYWGLGLTLAGLVAALAIRRW